MIFFDNYLQFFYNGKRLVYDNGNWVLSTSRHPAKPCSEFEARETLHKLKTGEIRGFGYSLENLERALSMFNRTGF